MICDFARQHLVLVLHGSPQFPFSYLSLARFKWNVHEQAIYGPIEEWDTSTVTNMRSVFVIPHVRVRYSQFNADISHWDVSNVEDMSYMFDGVLTFNQSLSSWNTSRVTNMAGMFNGCECFNGDISTWDVSQVTNMRSMFSDAISFNRDLSRWKTCKLTTTANMFFNAQSFNQPLHSWDLSRVTAMSRMFSHAKCFNQNISSWNTSNVLEMDRMFANAAAFNQPLDEWNVTKVQTIACMFVDAVSFNQPLDKWTNLHLYANVCCMFQNARSFNQSVRWIFPHLCATRYSPFEIFCETTALQHGPHFATVIRLCNRHSWMWNKAGTLELFFKTGLHRRFPKHEQVIRTISSIVINNFKIDKMADLKQLCEANGIVLREESIPTPYATDSEDEDDEEEDEDVDDEDVDDEDVGDEDVDDEDVDDEDVDDEDDYEDDEEDDEDKVNEDEDVDEEEVNEVDLELVAQMFILVAFIKRNDSASDALPPDARTIFDFPSTWGKTADVCKRLTNDIFVDLFLEAENMDYLPRRLSPFFALRL